MYGTWTYYKGNAGNQRGKKGLFIISRCEKVIHLFKRMKVAAYFTACTKNKSNAASKTIGRKYN